MDMTFEGICNSSIYVDATSDLSIGLAEFLSLTVRYLYCVFLLLKRASYEYSCNRAGISISRGNYVCVITDLMHSAIDKSSESHYRRVLKLNDNFG